MDTPKIQCQARTKTGHPCRNHVSRASGICNFHEALNHHKYFKKAYSDHAKGRLITNEMKAAIVETAEKDGYMGMTMEDMCAHFGPQIFYNMCHLAIHGKTEETQFRAGVFVSEKIYGKATMTVNHNIKQQIEHIILPALGQTMSVVDLGADGNPIIDAEVFPSLPALESDGYGSQKEKP